MMYAQTHAQRARLSGGGMFLAVALLVVGCEQAPDPAPIVPKKIDPKASFAKVVAQLKLKFRSFDDVSSLNSGNRGSRRVKFSYVVDEVSGQVHVPEDPDSGPITARVSVRTSTSYAPLDPYIDGGPITPFSGDETIGKSATTPADEAEAADRLAAKRAIARVEEEIRQRVREAVDASLSELGGENTDVFDFAYEDGRWVLTSEEVKDSDRIVIEDALTFQ